MFSEIALSFMLLVGAGLLMLVLSRGVILAIVGIAIGIAGAFGLTRYLTTLLFGVPPVDLLTFLSVAAILIIVALLACVIPARKAAKVDPPQQS